MFIPVLRKKRSSSFSLLPLSHLFFLAKILLHDLSSLWYASISVAKYKQLANDRWGTLLFVTHKLLGQQLQTHLNGTFQYTHGKCLKSMSQELLNPHWFTLYLTLLFCKLEANPHKNSNRKQLHLVFDTADTDFCHRVRKCKLCNSNSCYKKQNVCGCLPHLARFVSTLSQTFPGGNISFSLNFCLAL